MRTCLSIINYTCLLINFAVYCTSLSFLNQTLNIPQSNQISTATHANIMLVQNFPIIKYRSIFSQNSYF